MNKQFNAIYQSPVGLIGIVADESFLSKTTFLAIQDFKGKVCQPDNAIAKLTCKQLAEYFTGKRKAFDLPVKVVGTVFRQKVWKVMSEIPYGKTMTYGQVSKKLNCSPRAVGGACGHNNLPIIVPCHRIVGTNWLGGFAHFIEGKAVDMKSWLLAHEAHH